MGEQIKGIDPDAFFNFVDPSSGVLMNSDNQTLTYTESYAIETFLCGGEDGFQTLQLGMCRVIRHPVFGLNVYPATVFTTLELSKLKLIQFN